MTTQYLRMIACAVSASALLSPTANATVDAISNMTILSQELQTGDYCYEAVPVWGVYGVAGPIEMKAVFTPYNIPVINYDLTVRYQNINATATSPAMGFQVLSGDFIDFPDFSVRVNVSALSSANGTTVEGRQRTINSAKLSLLGMTKNLNRIGQGTYRLRVQFVGLPSQAGLSGTQLYATTTSPYSAPSTLLAAYERELVNVGGTCN